MRLIFLTFLGAAVISARATAQSNQQRCAELMAEIKAIDVDLQSGSITLSNASLAHITASSRRTAIEAVAGTPILDAVLDAEPSRSPAMRRFREENKLPPALDDFIKAGREAEFWRLAENEMWRTVEDIAKQLRDLDDRRTRVYDERRNLNCEPGPIEPSGPLPVERRPDGQPIITDALITRWVKASYALKNTGGAYWQAGQMTQQDYVEVDGRMNVYFNLLSSGRMSEQFSDAEMRAITARWPDIRNVREGNWSQIKLQ